MSVPTERVAEQVTDLKTAAVEHADSDTYEGYIDSNVTRGLRIGMGLLALEEVAEAKKWLGAVATVLTDELSQSAETEIERIRAKSGYDDATKWDIYLVDWQRGALAAMLSGDQSIQRTVGERLYDAMTADVIAELDNRWAEPRIDVDAVLGASLAGRDVAPHINKARRQLGDPDCRAFHRGLYLPLVNAIEAVDMKNPDDVVASIETLDEFHATNRQDYETTAPLERFLNLEAMAMVAHARQRGLSVEYASEYVPEAVSDPTHYPVN